LTIDPHEKRSLLKLYSDRLAQYGPTIAALGWTKPKARLRFRVLLEYWLSTPLTRPLRVLDFGCGFGDLFGYAQDRNVPIDYTGLDINSDLIRVARSRYPTARFLCADIFEQPLDEKFDIVLSSGAHNYLLSNNLKFIERSFELFSDMSEFGFAVNFLSDRVNYRNEQNYYSAPETILSLALIYTSRVTLRHDYMPFEFTVFVDKRAEIDENLNVFLPFVADCTG
jgi:SAM-dependent methyltransferase